MPHARRKSTSCACATTRNAPYVAACDLDANEHVLRRHFRHRHEDWTQTTQPVLLLLRDVVDLHLHRLARGAMRDTRGIAAVGFGTRGAKALPHVGLRKHEERRSQQRHKSAVLAGCEPIEHGQQLWDPLGPAAAARARRDALVLAATETLGGRSDGGAVVVVAVGGQGRRRLSQFHRRRGRVARGGRRNAEHCAVAGRVVAGSAMTDVRGSAVRGRGPAAALAAAAGGGEGVFDSRSARSVRREEEGCCVAGWTTATGGGAASSANPVTKWKYRRSSASSWSRIPWYMFLPLSIQTA